MKSLIRSLMDGDHILMDDPEYIERNKLVAYCDKCEEWWKFTRDMNPSADDKLCASCGGKPSSRHGFQPTTQRTFDSKAKKVSKAQLKKMGMTGA